jgi:hypothetical protein
MKKTPFPQAQMLDSRGVLPEWHGAVNNSAAFQLSMDNQRKRQAIRVRTRTASGAAADAARRLCPKLAQPPRRLVSPQTGLAKWRCAALK